MGEDDGLALVGGQEKLFGIAKARVELWLAAGGALGLLHCGAGRFLVINVSHHAVENAGDVGEINQAVGTEIFGAGGGHVVGIDVVQLIVWTEAETGSNGNEAFAPEGLYKGCVQAGEIADET